MWPISVMKSGRTYEQNNVWHMRSTRTDVSRQFVLIPKSVDHTPNLSWSINCCRSLCVVCHFAARWGMVWISRLCPFDKSKKTIAADDFGESAPIKCPHGSTALQTELFTLLYSRRRTWFGPIGNRKTTRFESKCYSRIKIISQGSEIQWRGKFHASFHRKCTQQSFARISDFSLFFSRSFRQIEFDRLIMHQFTLEHRPGTLRRSSTAECEQPTKHNGAERTRSSQAIGQ